MARLITELTAAGAITGATDLLWIEQGGLPRKVTPDSLGVGAPAWGSITGTLSAQTDLQAALDLKAPLASVVKN